MGMVWPPVLLAAHLKRSPFLSLRSPGQSTELILTPDWASIPCLIFDSSFLSSIRFVPPQPATASAVRAARATAGRERDRVMARGSFRREDARNLIRERRAKERRPDERHLVA